MPSDATPTPTDAPKVLYIIGKGRSGSTILDIALGSLDGYFASGELHFIWGRGVVENRRCGCGQPILECPVWSNALDEAFEGSGSDAARVAAWHDEVHTWKRVPRTLRAKPERLDSWPALAGYARATGSLYRAVQAQTGARVIVDSSKWPTGPGPLDLVPGIRAYAIQLVRDPRAVAHSWQRRKIQPDMTEIREMPRFGPVHSALSWSIRNVVAGRTLRRMPERSMVLRYEDLVADPRAALQRIIDLVEEPTNLDEVLRGRTLHLSGNHTVAGNPSRFSTGEVEIKPDVEWESRIKKSHRAIVTAMAFPMLRRFGYPIRKPAAPAGQPTA